MDVADRLDVGMVWINSAELGGPELPFGGTKRSGVGRELGPLFVSRTYARPGSGAAPRSAAEPDPGGGVLGQQGYRGERLVTGGGVHRL